MRISRRPLAVAVVLVSTLIACMGAEHLATTSQKAVVFPMGTSYDFGNVVEYTSSKTSPDPYFIIRAQSSLDDDFVESITPMPTCGSDFVIDLTTPLPAEVYCMGGATYGMAPGPSGSGMMTCSPVDYMFGATFTPTSAGPQACDVQIVTMPKSAGSGSGSTTTYLVHLTGTGIATQFSMKVAPSTTLDYGDVPLNSDSADQQITVTNNGSATIHVTASLDDTTDFQPVIAGTYTLVPNQLKGFGLHCHAGATAATYAGTVSFSTDATEGSLSGSVSLACRAVATSLSIQPNPIDLGTHLMGDSPTTVPVTITNTGAGVITLDSFAFANTPGTEVTYNPQPTSYTLNGAGSSATVNVKYAPTTERDVGPLGTMVFHANNMPSNVPMRGGAHTGSIGTNPASVDFGTLCAGNGSAIDVTVFANAGGDVTVSDPNGPSTPFTATLPGTGRTLLAHHASEIALSVSVATTASTAAGDYNDSVGLKTDIPGQMTVPIAVHAAVLAGGIAPTPTVVHFGPNQLAKPSPGQMVTLTNCGTGDLVVDASFTGPNGNEFAIVSPGGTHVTIPQTKSQQFLVVLTPQTTGAKTAQLVFTYASGSSMVALDGTGFGVGGDGGNKDRETYYACSIGGGAGAALPIALAAAFAVRRRRRRARARA